MNPHDVVLAFDLHSVIFTHDWRQVGKILWNYPHKLYAISCGFNLKFVCKSLHLFFDNPTDEEFFALFAQYCPKLVPLALDLMNAYKPQEPMVTIVQKLKSHGYSLHVVSNIGPRRYRTLCEKYPEIMNLFDKAKTINNDIDNLIKKPNPQFFHDYLRDYDPEHKKVIFIDDKKENVQSARSVGLQAIRFKNPSQLICQLDKMGIQI